MHPHSFVFQYSDNRCYPESDRQNIENHGKRKFCLCYVWMHTWMYLRYCITDLGDGDFVNGYVSKPI